MIKKTSQQLMIKSQVNSIVLIIITNLIRDEALVSPPPIYLFDRDETLDINRI